MNISNFFAVTLDLFCLDIFFLYFINGADFLLPLTILYHGKAHSVRQFQLLNERASIQS